MDARRVGGQAAVETVGIVIALAIAIAATTVWLQGAVTPPDHPPDVIGHASRPLGFPDGIRYWALPAVPYGEEGADEPIGDVLRGAGSRARSATRAYLAGRREFSGAYNRRLVERLRDLVRDPLGPPTVPGLDVLTPGGLARRALARGGDAYDYVQRLRRMPPGERTRTVLRDAGTAAADATIEGLQALARRRVGQGARRPAPRPPAPRDAPAP